MGGLLHLVHQGWVWVGFGPAQAHLCCTKCTPIKGQCTNFILFDVILQSKGLGKKSNRLNHSSKNMQIGPTDIVVILTNAV